MGNCLKTQLKEVVQNDNLEKLGELVLPSIGIDYLINIGANVAGVVATSNIPFYGTEEYSVNVRYPAVDYPTSTHLHIDADAKIKISNKYDISVLLIQNARYDVPVPIELLNYLDSPYAIYATFDGKISDVTETKPTLKYLYTNIDMSENDDVRTFFSKYPNLLELILRGQPNKVMQFDISNIGILSDLITLRVNDSRIFGSIDAIANEQKANRASGSTISINGNGIITYKSNGDGTGEDVVIPNDVLKTITFDGQGGYTIA